MPPSLASPIRITGQRKGLYSSACGVPEGPGECTPPAVSMNNHPEPCAAVCAVWAYIDARRLLSEGTNCYKSLCAVVNIERKTTDLVFCCSMRAYRKVILMQCRLRDSFGVLGQMASPSRKNEVQNGYDRSFATYRESASSSGPVETGLR